MEIFFLYSYLITENVKIDNSFDVFIIAIFMVTSVYICKLLHFTKISISEKFILVFNTIPIALFAYYFRKDIFLSVASINPKILLFIIQPLLNLRIGYGIDPKLIFQMTPQSLVLCTVGMIIMATILGVVYSIIVNFNVPYYFIFIFGLTLSTIDNIENSEALKQFEIIRYVIVSLECECVLGVAVGMILLQVLFGLADGTLIYWYQVLFVLLRYVFGGLLIGIICAWRCCRLLYYVYDNILFCCFSILAMIYSLYYICEYVLCVSGPIAIFILAVGVSFEKNILTKEVIISLIQIWETFYNIIEEILYSGCCLIYWYHCLVIFKDIYISEMIMIYVIAVISRLIMLLFVMPILVSMGHNFKYKSILALIWLPKKGIIQLLLYLQILNEPVFKVVAIKSTNLSLSIVALSLLINGSTSRMFLKTFGLTVVNRFRKNNMNNCISYIETKKKNFTTMMKTYRNLSDVNWEYAEEFTNISHPYTLSGDDEETDEEVVFVRKQSFCVNCKKDIVIQPTHKEIAQMIVESKIKVLKTHKVSFIRQHEKGLLSTDGLGPVLMTIEKSMATEDRNLSIMPLIRRFRKKFWYESVRDFLISIESDHIKLIPPRKMYRRICYHIVMNRVYELVNYGIIVILVFLSALQLREAMDFDRNLLEFIIFCLDFILKLFAYSHIYIKRGFMLYFRSHWNKIDFILLMVNSLGVIVSIICFTWKIELDMKYLKTIGFGSSIGMSFYLCTYLRLLKIIILLYDYKKIFIGICDSMLTARISYALDISHCLLLAYDEVLHSLPTIIVYADIRKVIEERINTDRQTLIEEITRIEKKMPWVSVSVKSKKAMRYALCKMMATILELKHTGMIDDVDLLKLTKMYELKMNRITMLKTVPIKSYEDIYYEVPWLCNSHDLAIFLYINSNIVTYEPNEVIINEGDIVESIYIITEGYAMLKYNPRDEAESLNGTLPVKDYLTSIHFTSPKKELLLPGNSIGELCALTHRPSNCTVVSETVVKAFAVPVAMLKESINYRGDTKNSLFNDLWIFIGVHLSVSILWESLIYKSFNKEELYVVLMEGFAPDLSKRRSFVNSTRIKDIILIEGVVEDIKTNHLYYAPCFLPRSAQKLILRKDTRRFVETKLIIIPEKREYIDDIMNYEELSDINIDDTLRTKLPLTTTKENKPGELRSILKKPKLG